MSQSLARILIHLVFSTRDRVPCLNIAVRADLQAYLAGTCRHLGCPARFIAIQPEHVHMLFELSRTLSLAKVVEEVKTASSKWIKRKDPDMGDFHWQDGYAAFSISDSRVTALHVRLAAQHRLHKSHSFEDELRLLLALHDIRHDERYLWG